MIDTGIVESRPDAQHTVWHIDAPQRRNAIGPAALEWIANRCAALQGDTVVLTGRGERSFCAGFDLTALTPGGAQLPDASLIAATSAIQAANATFIAAVGGYAIGAGVELACACDFVVARRGVFFEVPAARLGVVYHADGLARLHATMGPAVTRRLLLLGERLTAAQAAEAGAQLQLVEPEQLGPTVNAMVRQLAATTGPSVEANRRLLRELAHHGLPPDVVARHEHARREAYRVLTRSQTSET